MQRCVLYCRMSTDKQENSIESQEQVLMSYAKRNRMTVIEKYTDEGISGRDAKKRPAFMRMLDDSEKGLFDFVLVYDSSRFARNLEESIVYKSALKRNGVKLISATEPTLDDDSALISDAMLGALNEMYSRKLSKAVRRGMVFGAQKGNFQTPPAFGYSKFNGVTTIIPEQSKIVKMIFEMFDKHPAYHSIAVRLNEMGVTTRTGKAWRATDVKRILRNRSYIGEVFYSGEYYKGKHEPIVDAELFESVQAHIAAKPPRRSRSESTYKHWLSGVVKCFACGSAMNHVTDKNGNRSYRCSGHASGKCNYSNFMSVPKLEKLMQRSLDKFINDENTINYEYFVPRPNSQNELDSLEQALKNNAAKLDRCKKAYTAGVDTLEEYSENKQALKKEAEAIERKINDYINKDDKESRLNALRAKIIELNELLYSDEYTTEQKSIALKALISKIILNKYEKSFDVFYFL